ncbi:hypothetical protein FSP39_019189 [Pinctada imbricata]|uniref:SRCR domain-containing protein n=1 Tax=Pinctada imbricata TaxID=66713 RepID=A0AA89BNW9_PINIB|nr:hypothetical protein FSP39_019189 [Pinctada imbricata]
MGRVEVNLDDGTGWGTVCDDLFDEKDARVVCRSLGLPYSVVSVVTAAKFGQGKDFVQMDDLMCNGSETALNKCPFKNRTTDNCGHGEDVGVICWQERTYHPVIRNPDSMMANPLDGGLTLQLARNEDFNISICKNKFDRNVAKVTCFQIHGIRENSYPLKRYEASGISGTPLCLQLNCTGREASLSECSEKPAFLPNDDDVPPGILCGYEKVNRIAMKATRLEGRFIIVDKEQSTIECETAFARPKPAIIWYLDGNITLSLVKTSSIVSGSMYKAISNLTITPDDFTHGKTLQCCSNDTLGHTLCTQPYNLFVTGVSRFLSLSNNMNKEGNQFSNSAQNQDIVGSSNSQSHFVIGYILSGGTILLLSIIVAALVYMLHKTRNLSGHQKQEDDLKTQLVMENYEVVKKSNDKSKQPEVEYYTPNALKLSSAMSFIVCSELYFSHRT